MKFNKQCDLLDIKKNHAKMHMSLKLNKGVGILYE